MHSKPYVSNLKMSETCLVELAFCDPRHQPVDPRARHHYAGGQGDTSQEGDHHRGTPRFLESGICELLPHLAAHGANDEAIENELPTEFSPAKAYCTTPLNAVQRNMRAQEDEPTFGRMSSVMKRGPIIIPPPITEQLGSNTSEDCDGRGFLKRIVAPLYLTVVGFLLTVSLELAASISPRPVLALQGLTSDEHEAV